MHFLLVGRKGVGELGEPPSRLSSATHISARPSKKRIFFQGSKRERKFREGGLHVRRGTNDAREKWFLLSRRSRTEGRVGETLLRAKKRPIWSQMGR